MHLLCSELNLAQPETDSDERKKRVVARFTKLGFSRPGGNSFLAVFHCEEGIMDWFYLVSSTVFSLRTTSGLGSEPVFKQTVEFE